MINQNLTHFRVCKENAEKNGEREEKSDTKERGRIRRKKRYTKKGRKYFIEYILMLCLQTIIINSTNIG